MLTATAAAVVVEVYLHDISVATVGGAYRSQNLLFMCVLYWLSWRYINNRKTNKKQQKDENMTLLYDAQFFLELKGTGICYADDTRVEYRQVRPCRCRGIGWFQTT